MRASVRWITGVVVALATAACAQITGISKYDDCSGDTCDASTNDGPAVDGDAQRDGAVDETGCTPPATNVCATCRNTSCPAEDEACRCDRTCRADVYACLGPDGPKICTQCGGSLLAMNLLACLSASCHPVCCK